MRALYRVLRDPVVPGTPRRLLGWKRNYVDEWSREEYIISWRAPPRLLHAGGRKRMRDELGIAPCVASAVNLPPLWSLKLERAGVTSLAASAKPPLAALDFVWDLGRSHITGTAAIMSVTSVLNATQASDSGCKMATVECFYDLWRSKSYR